MHTTLDTKSTQHVVMSMWVWLVGVGHGYVSAKITLLCYCTHSSPPYPYFYAIFGSACLKLHIVQCTTTSCMCM